MNKTSWIKTLFSTRLRNSYKHKSIRMIVVVGVILLCGLLLWIHQKDRSRIHQTVRDSYFSGSYQEAMGYAKEYHSLIISEEEGCELLISIYATLKSYSLVESTARTCLSMNKATAIAAEALAMSLSAVGRSEEAIALIHSEVNVRESARVMAALAQLYVYTGKTHMAQEHLLGAIRHGNPWSPWLGRVFSSRTFYADKDFLKQVVELVLAKKTVILDLESQLMSHMQHLGMTYEKQRLKTRIEHAKAANKAIQERRTNGLTGSTQYDRRKTSH